ncbi:MAG: hypothetical protein ACYTEX_25875 [Planctomycetota bacterium]|jgi:hypothetical protein
MDDLGQAMKADPRIADAMMGKIDEVLPGLRVDESTAKALKAMGEVAEPRNQAEWLKLADRVTSMYKGWLFVPWLASHTRNWISGFWNAATDQAVGFGDLVKGHAAAVRHMTKGEGLRFAEEGIQAGVLEGLRIADIAGEAAEAAMAMPAKGVPKGFVGGILEPLRLKNLRTSWKRLFDPTAIRGARREIPALPIGEYRQAVAQGEKAVPMNPWMQAGEEAYRRIEAVNRLGYYEALRDAGYTSSQAKYYVRRSQFDYGALSRFEKETMRRLVPFYGWIRNNIPLQFQKLLERPGGQAAQTYRAFLQAQRPGEGKPHTPQFLREMMAVPVGEGAEGMQTFLRQAGLPIEDLNRFIFEGGIPSTKTLRKFASQLHPLLVGPAEMWAGKQLWTDRPLKHMASQTEALTRAIPGVEEGVRIPAIDRALAMSPLSRAAGEAMGVLDARPEKSWWMKAMNSATGLRFSTYDVERWRLMDMRNRLAELAERSPYVYQAEHLYIPERYRPRAQEEKKQLQTLRALEQAGQKLAAKRRREGKGAQ